MMSDLPQFHALFEPTLSALKALGGSGSVDEIAAKVLDSLDVSQEVLDRLHNPGQGNQTEIEYRLAWARTYLKKCGFIDNSTRGVWTLTEKAERLDDFKPDEIVRLVRERSAHNNNNKKEEDDLEAEPEVQDAEWRSQLFRLLTRELSPAAFERLIQRLLRESGFIQVEVTGRTGDGGIDGKGIAKIHGLMSFHVVFQCKRWQGVVSSGQIRDFRGAMIGRADKGLFITTGTYSRDALKEATRDGASPIDLLDGDQLADKLKELRLGVEVEMVERVTIDPEWFKSI